MAALSTNLRQRAERLLAAGPAETPTLPTKDVQAVLHELRVHQAELEIQNEELRRAQLELSETRDRYVELYEFAPVGYLTADPQGLVQEANLTLARMLAVERRRLLGSHLEKFLTPEGRDDWHRHRRSVVAGEVKETVEFELHRLDGKAFTARLESVATGAGATRRCLTAVSDITRSRHAEDALGRLNIRLDGELQGKIDQLHLLTEAVAHLGEGVMITGDHPDWPDARILFANEAMARISGYAPAELIGQTPRMLESAEAVGESPARTRSESGGGSFQARHRRRDGTPYESEITVAPIFDAEGHRTNFVSIHRDVTERERVQAALLQSRQELADFFAEASVGLLMLDPAGVIVRANAVAASLLGEPTEPAGRAVADFFADPVAGANLVRRIAAGEVAANERARIGKGAAARYVLIDANACWRNDVQLHSRWFLRDITDRVELEREVLTISAREQERFAHDLHDDLCQRLTGIEFLCQSLATDLRELTDPGAELAEKIGRLAAEAVEQGRQLARDLSPLTLGGQGLVAVLRELAADTTRRFGLPCEYEGPDDPDLHDRILVNHLYRIAQGAISNVVRHARAGRIWIRLEQTPQDLKLSVRDDGIGLSETTPRTGGFGLRIMQHRASLIEGAFTALRRTEGGTEVACILRRRPADG